MSDWPAWATVKVDKISLKDARNCLISAQGFWRDFALAGLTMPDLRDVIEERRRKGPQGKIAIPKAKIASSPKPAFAKADNGLFDTFPPLDPDDARWMHA